ncbi:efflux RND transporter periplasmic adaptor subunit [Campylobacter sp. CCS1377]|uniref:Efflux RND transporter periplasmic adaptor subunit n=1 Tax=Campylobacter sp. CCS1377 TaxID=3158229 RepID=A0AAU7E840_9BACT|nr:efflux RND transporter periplasmic adaptor subunit [Campylobacter jejuni]
MKKIILFLMSVFSLHAEEIYASFDVIALNSSKLAIESIGIIKEIKVDVAQKVKKGEILLTLDNTSEKIALQNAKNDHELALVAFNNAKSRLEKFKKVQSVIDKQSYEDILAEYEKQSLLLQKAKINIKYYENLLDKKILKAPYDGIISAKFKDIGDGVGGVSQPLLEIFSYPEVKLLISFDEQYKDKVKIGQNYIYKIDKETKEYQGKISLIYPSIDTKTRKIYAEVRARNLTPGLFGEGRIQIKEK